MPVERREARRVTQYSFTPEVCEDGPFKGYVKLHWIRSAAERKREEKVRALAHHINPQNLRRAFRELDGSSACGVLNLNLDKSGIVPFTAKAPGGFVSFLGFDFYWGRNANGERALKLKTSSKKLNRCMKAFTDWIK